MFALEMYIILNWRLRYFIHSFANFVSFPKLKCLTVTDVASVAVAAAVLCCLDNPSWEVWIDRGENNWFEKWILMEENEDNFRFSFPLCHYISIRIGIRRVIFIFICIFCLFIRFHFYIYRKFVVHKIWTSEEWKSEIHWKWILKNQWQLTNERVNKNQWTENCSPPFE